MTVVDCGLKSVFHSGSALSGLENRSGLVVKQPEVEIRAFHTLTPAVDKWLDFSEPVCPSAEQWDRCGHLVTGIKLREINTRRAFTHIRCSPFPTERI